VSTEATVRQAIVDVIKSKITDLGLVNADTINDRLILVLHGERSSKFLKGCTDEKRNATRTRAWGVQVIAFDGFRPTTGRNASRTVERTYQIAIEGYYEVDDVNLMIDHARIIRGAVIELGPSLGISARSFIPLGVSEPFNPQIAETGDFVTLRMDWTATTDCDVEF